MTAKETNPKNIKEINPNFKLTRSTEIKELRCTLRELVHVPTGALVMQIENEDPENLFCLSFQTLPESSNGVAHILEHTVLCGSEKFPIKDPFFAMNRRSLNTFMNALTGADFTCYPAATQNKKDFYNLLEVYLDAVFHPKLEFLSFLQEGHRLEFANPTDPKTNLEYKGIVFNEMKGSLSSPDSRLNEILNQALFPDITYGHNSGGDPKHIPDLTHEELIDFHKYYYHPSRCLFFFYGNMPLETHLDFIEKNALNGIEKLSPLPKPKLQPRFKERKYLEAYYPISSDENLENKSFISFGFLTCHVLEQEEILALSVIEIILMDTDASPLKRALLNSRLCKQASCYIETDYTEIPLVITLRGCNPSSKEALEKILFDTLNKIVQEGISETAVENALHRLEFFRTEITGDHTPFGLSLFFRSGLIKQHGSLPEQGLMIHSLFQKLREHIINDPSYLTHLIKKYLIDNPHFVRVTLMPDQDLAAKEIAEELESLKKVRSKLTEDALLKLLKQTTDLNHFQKKQEEEDLSVLPKVTLDDVEKKVIDFKLKEESFTNLKVFHHECFTNEIVYADITFNLPYITEEELPFVRLFTILLTQVGSNDRSYLETLEKIQAKTGGISASLALNIQAADNDQFHPALHLHGKALHRNAKELFEIIVDTISTPNFLDKERIKELILKHYTALQSSFTQNALKYAINLSANSLNLSHKIMNEWYGMPYFHAIQEIATHLDEKIEGILEKLNDLKEKLLALHEPELIITSDQPIYEWLKQNDFFGLNQLKKKAFKPFFAGWLLKPFNETAAKNLNAGETKIISSPVAFIGKVFKTISYIEEDAAVLSISSFLLDNVVLHQKIREQGGAYGGGAVANSTAGTYYFYSYRDPNILSTLAAFEEAIKVIGEGNFDEEELQEAKLEMIQGLDAPVSPGSRGYLAYCYQREGKTVPLRQKFRDKVLSLTAKDVIDVVKKYIKPGFLKGKTMIFAGKELIEKENAELVSTKQAPLIPIKE